MTTRRHCMRALALSVSLANVPFLAVAVNADASNLFGDPFGVVTAGLAGCAEPLGPAWTADEARREAHGRIERGTSCYQSGRCRLPNAYHYDAEIFPRAVRFVRSDGRFATASVWIAVQRRWVVVYGCVRSSEQGHLLEATLRQVDDVEVVLPLWTVGASSMPPYKPRQLSHTQ